MSSYLEALRGRERDPGENRKKEGEDYLESVGTCLNTVISHKHCIHYCLWYLRPKPAEPSSDPSALKPVRRSDPETAWFGCLVCPKPDRWWEQRLPSKIRVPTD